MCFQHITQHASDLPHLGITKTTFLQELFWYEESNFCISAILNVLTHCERKIVSEYDQEIPQSQTADNPVAPRGRATQPSRDMRETN